MVVLGKPKELLGFVHTIAGDFAGDREILKGSL